MRMKLKQMLLNLFKAFPQPSLPLPLVAFYAQPRVVSATTKATVGL